MTNCLAELAVAASWPEVELILAPPGEGASVVLERAREKIGAVLLRSLGPDSVRVGVLTSDPSSNASEYPLAVVCDFDRPVPEEVLSEAHRLAWNFCQVRMLITVEPHQIRVWSAFEAPTQGSLNQVNPDREVMRPIRVDHQKHLSDAVRALRWIDLVTGAFFERHANRFQKKHRADQTLLSSLKWVRKRLIKVHGLHPSTCHDLLARVIFVQFLFHRQDRTGNAAIDRHFLEQLRKDGRLRARYESFGDVMRSHDDCYNLFRYLNDRFNGDFFPGKGNTPEEREAEWQREMAEVKPEHLQLLADFIDGRIKGGSPQLYLWPQYRFDTIPLEFISSIYEEFVGHDSGVHYTPSRLVDLVLDSALPWKGVEWDLRVLDPACGSGIFLVKAYQRLLHRWRQANPGQDPEPATLARLLEHNIAGCDIHEDAVRVASFSLYLAMADAIDPKVYWTRVRFPSLRMRRIRKADFFCDDELDAIGPKGHASYDIIVGNAPWGDNTIQTSMVATWAKVQTPPWPMTGTDIGPAFIGRALTLAREGARVALFQPAGPWLYHRGSSAIELRRRLLSGTTHTVEDITNLTPVRRKLFERAVSPVCLVSIWAAPPADPWMSYTVVKPDALLGHVDTITLQPENIHTLDRAFAAEDDLVWSVLVEGGMRDLHLVRRLMNGRSTLGDLLDGTVNAKVGFEGFTRGNADLKTNEWTIGMPLLEVPRFPEGTLCTVEPSRLRRNQDPCFTRSRSKATYKTPQLIVRKSFESATGSFGAAINESDEGILCCHSYLSVPYLACDAGKVKAALVALNSMAAAYFLLMTSSRGAQFRGEVLAKELRLLPIPRADEIGKNLPASREELNEIIFEAYGLAWADRILIEDYVSSRASATIADAEDDEREGSNGRGNARTGRTWEEGRFGALKSYLEVLAHAIRASYGPGHDASFIVYEEEPDTPLLPVRMVCVLLGVGPHGHMDIVQIPSDALLRERLAHVSKLSAHQDGAALSFSRSIHVYDTIEHGAVQYPGAYLIKRDRPEYWTRTRALEDADVLAMDILRGARSIPERPTS